MFSVVFLLFWFYSFLNCRSVHRHIPLTRKYIRSFTRWICQLASRNLLWCIEFNRCQTGTQFIFVSYFWHGCRSFLQLCLHTFWSLVVFLLQELTLWAFPKTAGVFDDALVCCIKENPEPVIFRLRSHGVRPELELDKRALHFEKVLLHRYLF